jgi:hypothetical protein
VGGLDPDNRSIEGGGLISIRRWGDWQKPAGDEQQNRKRAPDKDKITNYRQLTAPDSCALSIVL